MQINYSWDIYKINAQKTVDTCDIFVLDLMKWPFWIMQNGVQRVNVLIRHVPRNYELPSHVAPVSLT